MPPGVLTLAPESRYSAAFLGRSGALLSSRWHSAQADRWQGSTAALEALGLGLLACWLAGSAGPADLPVPLPLATAQHRSEHTLPTARGAPLALLGSSPLASSLLGSSLLGSSLLGSSLLDSSLLGSSRWPWRLAANGYGQGPGPGR